VDFVTLAPEFIRGNHRTKILIAARGREMIYVRYQSR
jgi:translation initiation factor IF-3